MGISGLLPFLKKASRPVHVREFSNSTAAIDVYCWLHKGAFGCAEKLIQGQPTNGYITYLMKYIDLLLHHNIKPILVFDGRNLPSKAGTEAKRRENRTKYRQMAKDYLREGRHREARECFQRCVDITPEMAREVIRACQERNIDCVVAPYEADAQLAFLNLSGIADLIISEDSDLTLFGCERILFKLDVGGNGVLYEKSHLNLCLGGSADSFSFEKFRHMCIMSGCDYLSSLHGIGLGKSFKFWTRVTNSDLQVVLPKIPGYLRMPQLTVTEQYVEGFLRAENTFLYQIVFDTRERRQRPLNDYPASDRTLQVEDLSYAGTLMEDRDAAFQMALGNLDLHTLQKVQDFHPDRTQRWVEKPTYGKRTGHASIWRQEEFEQWNETKFTKQDSATTEDKVVQTAFGSMTRRAGQSKTAGTEEKRKLEEVAVSPEEEDGFVLSSARKRSRLDLEEDSELSPVKIYRSRYFSQNAGCEREENKRVDENTLRVYGQARLSSSSSTSPSTPASKSKASASEKTSTWFSELDKDKADSKTDDDNDDDNGRLAVTEVKRFPVRIERIDASHLLGASSASKQPFKPVLTKSYASDSKNDDVENNCKRRNPFAVAKRSPQKSPLVEVNCNASSQLSSSCSIDRDSFGFSQELPTDDGGCTEAYQEDKVMSQKKEFSAGSLVSSEVSSYFSQSSFATSKTGMPKGVLGLLRRSKENKQRTIIDMWKKS